MKVGVPTEIKTDEYRVALTPAGVRELVEHGHEVLVQAGAGEGSAIEDAHYEAQGARIVPDAEAVFGEADMIVKVKEPQPVEVARLEPRHTLFTYLHLAPDPDLTAGLVASGATCVAYETVEDARGRLPLLAPMSEVAGKIATQAGAFMLEKPLGGRGILLGGVPGDVSIDQGGCFETSRPTTHSDPTYEVDGVTHYCVANMLGAVPITSTYALTNATLPYVLRLAGQGPAALMSDPGFLRGLNVAAGRVTYEPV